MKAPVVTTSAEVTWAWSRVSCWRLVQCELSADWATAGAASRKVAARNASGRMAEPLYRRIGKKEPYCNAAIFRPEGARAVPELRYTVSQELRMATTSMVHVRVDERVKEKAAATLAKMGISVSDAVRMMLVRVAEEKALPFAVRVPNPTTVKAMRSADRKQGKRFRSTEALFKDLGI
jgi:DNA-damage-inducible protein J